MSIENFIKIFLLHESKYENSISLIASENFISPLAAKIASSDIYNRYFFEQSLMWGDNAFAGSQFIKQIYSDVLIPNLQRLTKAKHVSARPISGLNCMTIVLDSYCNTGDTIITLSPDIGGHPSTKRVAKKFGLNIIYLPVISYYEPNIEELNNLLHSNNIKLIYIDQSCALDIFNIKPIVTAIKQISPSTYLHVDTSHWNGLIFGEVINNPLADGAHSIGGSTHKTFPGPIKGFFATNDIQCMKLFYASANHLISHQHTGSTCALAIALQEFIDLKGQRYSHQIIRNAQAFAKIIDQYKISVIKHNAEYTRTHQVWINPKPHGDGNNIASKLYEANLIVSCFPSLPGIENEAIRLGFNEITRFGIKEDDMYLLADAFKKVIIENKIDEAKIIVANIRKKFNPLAYAYSTDILDKYKSLDRRVNEQIL